MKIELYPNQRKLVDWLKIKFETSSSFKIFVRMGQRSGKTTISAVLAKELEDNFYPVLIGANNNLKNEMLTFKNLGVEAICISSVVLDQSLIYKTPLYILVEPMFNSNARKLFDTLPNVLAIGSRGPEGDKWYDILHISYDTWEMNPNFSCEQLAFNYKSWKEFLDFCG